MLEVKQKIDLYLPRFQPEKLSVEVRILFLSILVVFILSFLSGSVLFFINYNLEQQIVEAKQDQEQINEALVRAISQIPNTTADANLINRIAREKIVLRKNKQVREYLYQDRIGKGENFTDLVDQLGKQSVKGIWLSKFEIMNKGKDIQLFGYAKTPKQISKYIEMLGTQESYRGRNFQQIQINKSEKRWSEFYISTLTMDDVLAIKNPLIVRGK
jgi:Tfp pilus assembly protein PilN